jgi:hypothetical protein
MTERNKAFIYDPKFEVLETPEFIARVCFTSGWEQVPDAASGVECKTFCLQGVSESARDGALVRIPKGMQTPVQQIATDHTFWEIALEGNPTLLTVSPEGKYTFGAKGLELTRGWSMVWAASYDTDGLVLEFEKPSFETAKLLTVPKGSTTFNNKSYPLDFWRDLAFLESRIK